MRILVIADPFITNLVRDGLAEDDMTVEAMAGSGLNGTLPDCETILLDPKQLQEPGWAQVAHWRREGLESHIVILSPRNSAGAERAAYLDAGADLCLLHPLSVEELKAH